MTKKQFDELILLTNVDIHGRKVLKPYDDVVQKVIGSVESRQPVDKLGTVEPRKDTLNDLRKDELHHLCNAELRRNKKHIERPQESTIGWRTTHGRGKNDA